jgi:hypothetical protein
VSFQAFFPCSTRCTILLISACSYYVCVAMSHEASLFLSLPKDVRLMVYEQLQPSNKYVRLSNQPDQDPGCAILVARSIEFSILATCRIIHNEAHRLPMKIMQDALSRSSLQILLPMRGNAAEMVVLFLGAVRDHVKRLCQTYGPSSRRDTYN